MTPSERISTTWTSVLPNVPAASSAAQAAQKRMLAAYQEPHRAYHTLDHIAALLLLLDQHGIDPPAHDPQALRLAILYHDIVYNPRRTDNEAASADVATRDLTALGLAPVLIRRVAALVLATQHGTHKPDPADTDLVLLLDLDLSVLAADPQIYDAYATAIRREYAHVPGLLYRPGRRRVLQNFLNADELYLTPRLRAAWDAPARANLTREIGSLG
jgi:predicted metal-dependent HD superfamily phosphohydrolase